MFKYRRHTLVFLLQLMVFKVTTGEIAYDQGSELGSGGKVTLRWGFDNETIKFKVTAETAGWVGMGFSKTGSMKQSDIIILWVKDNKGHIVDMHAHTNGLPNVDESQDYILESAWEKNGVSNFKFSRKIKNCDEFDSDMGEHTYRVIWAYGDNDPDGADVTVDEYHGDTNRGVQSLKLMNNPPEAFRKGKEIGNVTVMSYDIRPVRFQVPARSTYYHCKMFKMPEMNGKHHIIQYDPVITRGNEKKVHHMSVHLCKRPGKPRFSVEGAECYVQVRPFALGCSGIPMSYSIGSSRIIYPPHVGYPIGEENTAKYLLLETHYNNPGEKVFTDSSGMRMFYTAELRPVDAGILILGYVTSPTMAIPPGSGDFAVQGHCHERCLKQAFSKSTSKEITVVAGGLHAHETGRRLSLRHFRKGVEKAPILKDDFYDVEYQDGQYLSENVKVQTGDRLVVECTYDTTQRKNFTFGGLSIKDEMCSAYIAYYPRIDLSLCMSSISTKSFLKSFNATTHAELTRNSQKMVWNSKTINDFNTEALESPISPMCQSDSGFYMNYSAPVPVPKSTKEYVDRSSPCSSAQRTPHTVSLWSFILLCNIILSKLCT